MDLPDFLKSKNSKLVFHERGEGSNIIVGVPHHAPLGTSRMPCESHTMSDENAGIIGFDLANRLNCSSIIACNYFIDVNKSEETDYFTKLVQWDPKLVIEIHGHSGKKSNYDIEISSGNQGDDKYSLALAKNLRKKLSTDRQFYKYSISGDYDAIFFKASQSLSITTDRWTSLHIELPYGIRKSISCSEQFSGYLAACITELFPGLTGSGKNV